MHSFSGLSIGFSMCAKRTARQRSWLPGSGGMRYPGNCGKLLVCEVAQHPPLAGSGVQLAPQWGMGQRPIVTPSNFCFRKSFSEKWAQTENHFPKNAAIIRVKDRLDKKHPTLKAFPAPAKGVPQLQKAPALELALPPVRQLLPAAELPGRPGV